MTDHAHNIQLQRTITELHDTIAELRNTNAALMHQNANLTREIESLRATLQTSEDEYNEVLEQRQALDGQIAALAPALNTAHKALAEWQQRAKLYQLANETHERTIVQLEAKLNEAEGCAITYEFQDEIRDKFLKALGPEFQGDIDGAGSDAGPLEFTLAEISIGIRHLLDQRDDLKSQLSNLRSSLAGSDATASREDAPSAEYKLRGRHDIALRVLEMNHLRPIYDLMIEMIRKYANNAGIPPAKTTEKEPMNSTAKDSAGYPVPAEPEQIPVNIPDEPIESELAHAPGKTDDVPPPAPNGEDKSRAFAKALTEGAEAIRDSLTLRPLAEYLGDVIDAVTKAQEKHGGALKVEIDVVAQERGNSARLTFTL